MTRRHAPTVEQTPGSPRWEFLRRSTAVALATALTAATMPHVHAAGLQCRHSVNRQMLIERIRNGEIGDIVMARAYRVHPAPRLLVPKPPTMSELFWQIRNFTQFLGVSGGPDADGFYPVPVPGVWNET